MIEADKILQDYESISRLTGKMLQAAREGEWERLTTLERECRTIVDGLRSLPAEGHDGPAFAQRKLEILRKILADDAAIRNLTEPWMAQLASVLDGASNARKVRAAYGEDTGGR
jgi:flagellar protein FliT